MIRDVDFEKISDGNIYRANDMVRLGCSDCDGCHACCQGMGDSLVLDPFDIYMLNKGTNMSFEELLAGGYIELSQHKGVILPNIKMEPKCRFLDENGRCSIHEFRPGICRLFPLGRIYEENGFGYFLQVNECKKTNRTKVKIKKWLGITSLYDYEKYILVWHKYVSDIEEAARNYMCNNGSRDAASYEVVLSKMNSDTLRKFYIAPYNIDEDFYSQFMDRM